jgi:hypothetical protein
VKNLADKKISLRLDTDLADKLEGYAAKERVPVSFVLRHLVLRFFASPLPEFRGSALGTTPKGRFSSEEAALRRSAALARTERDNAEFETRVFTLFDNFTGQGFDMKEAAKRTNFAMKEKKHPWATYEVIASVLRKSGRFRRVK